MFGDILFYPQQGQKVSGKYEASNLGGRVDLFFRNERNGSQK